MIQTDSPESAIIEKLTLVGICSLSELTSLLPRYSWAQVFAAVDRLVGEGTIALNLQYPFRYLLSLAPPRSFKAHLVTP